MAEPNLGGIKPPGDIPVDKESKKQLAEFVADSRRLNREEDAKHWLFVVLLWAGGLAFVFVLIAKVWHLLCSDSYAWLNEERLKGLNDFLTNSFIGGAVASIFKSKFTGSDKGQQPK